jgi:Lon protease-like protein
MIPTDTKSEEGIGMVEGANVETVEAKGDEFLCDVGQVNA